MSSVSPGGADLVPTTPDWPAWVGFMVTTHFDLVSGPFQSPIFIGFHSLSTSDHMYHLDTRAGELPRSASSHFWFISPLTLSLEIGIVSGLLVNLVYWFISPCTLSPAIGIVSGLLVYFIIDTFAGEWDSVRFIGLFGLLVYFTMGTFAGE